MKLQVAKSGFDFDLLIMKRNYRQVQQGSLPFLFLFVKELQKSLLSNACCQE